MPYGIETGTWGEFMAKDRYIAALVRMFLSASDATKRVILLYERNDQEKEELQVYSGQLRKPKTIKRNYPRSAELCEVLRSLGFILHYDETDDTYCLVFYSTKGPTKDSLGSIIFNS